MKMSVRKALVLLAIVLSFVSIQSVWATCDQIVTGNIIGITSNTITIKVDEDVTKTVYGIPFDYLSTKKNIELKMNDHVDITAFVCPNDGYLSACTLSVNDGEEITLPGKRLR